MRKGRVLGLLGILTVAGLLWWGVRSPEAPAPLPEDELPLALAASFSGPAPSAAPDSAAPALGPGSLAGRKDFALPDRPPVWLVVQVVRKDGGVPLAGVPVEITWAALGAMGPGVSGITGPDGRFRFPVQLSMEWVEARALPFRAGAARWGEPPPGSARAVLYNPAWKPGKGKERERKVREAGEEVPLFLALPGGGRVAGRVVDEEGQPVAGARVLAWRTNPLGVAGQSLNLEQGAILARLRPPAALIENETVADRAGRFLLEGVEGKIAFAALAPGFDAVRTAHAVVAAGVLLEGVELRLAEARAVTVEVRDSYGLPAREFILLAMPASSRGDTTRSGGPGVWYLDGPLGALQAARLSDRGRVVLPHLTRREFDLQVYDGPALIWEGALDPNQSSIRITLVAD